MRILFSVQALICVVLCSVPYFAAMAPWCVHFGSRRWSDYSPQEQQRLMPLLKDMMGWMSLLASLFFAVNIHLQIRSALAGSPSLSNLWMHGLLLVCETATVFYYLRRFDEELDES